MGTEGDDFVQFLINGNAKMKKNKKGEIVLKKDGGSVVMYDEKWLIDLVSNCGDLNPRSSCMFIDVTFDLGGFYCIQISYLHTSLESERSGECPLVQGPSIFVQERDFEHYAVALGILSVAIAKANPQKAKILICSDR